MTFAAREPRERKPDAGDQRYEVNLEWLGGWDITPNGRVVWNQKCIQMSSAVKAVMTKHDKTK